MKHPRLAAAALVLLAAGLPVLAQPRPGTAELPVTRVVLFSSGVGYFQREGPIDGTARIDLQFPSSQINDLLKSLVLQDTGGGQISTVSYDNREPIDKTLKSFAIDLTSNPSIGQLLSQVRGERVEVISYGEQGKEGQPTTLSGVIVGVQTQKKPVGKDQVLETEQLNLLTSEGLHGVALGQVQRVRFLKPELEQEFRKALEVLATGHDKQKKTVSLNFLGSGKRDVRVGYVTESPIWKTSYRLSLDKASNKVFLQGWAIVENTTDEDWNQVRLGLVSGRPISFQMDLYEPLYVPRPMVEPELFASLRPQVYGGDVISAQSRLALTSPAPAKPALEAGRPFGAAPAERRSGLGRAEAGALARKLTEKDAKDKAAFDFREGVASAAIATELGEYFQYQIEQPVSLPRQKSALLPIVQQPVEATRVSIYNEGVHGKFPLLGLRFKNTTGLHLMQGPVTLFEGSSYAGDARVADLQPNETRLLSYAVDLGTEVLAERKQADDTLVAVKVYKGILEATHKVRQTKVYTVKNRSEHDRLVLLEHPYRSDWKLISPEKAAERSREVYRFEVKAKPNQPVQQEVVEELRHVQTIALSNSDDETVRFFLRSSITTAKVREALEQALKLKSQLAQTQRQVGREEQALKAIEQDQARMRANMERVPQTSEAYKRYLKKFDDQETEIEKRREQIAKLQESAEQQRKAYENFLLTLNVE
ncbi:MAG: DUF4139 domain-containing protein [Gemmataceae bacterium]|nr:DUF4139 domain-containing protein [Gemmataceae bacterium]